jgi:hypothetical protein
MMQADMRRAPDRDRGKPESSTWRAEMASVLVIAKMYPDPTGLDDPERAVDGSGLRDRQKCPQPLQQCADRGTRPELQDDDAGTEFGRKAAYVPEVAVERDQNAILGNADLEQAAIRCTTEALIANGHHVVAGCSEQFGSTASDILVELDLHACPVTGTGTMRSRVISAP